MKSIQAIILSLVLVFASTSIQAAQDTVLHEIRSQVTHAAIGFIPTALLGPLGIPLVAVWVYSWENSQHPGECNAGCMRDVSFYTFGTAIGLAVH